MMIEGAVGLQFDAQHIVDADMRNHRAEEVGMLGQFGAHQQATVAAAFDRKFRSVGIFVIDQIMRAGGEVVEHVLFFRQHAGLVPGFAIFAAAAQIGNGDYYTVVEQRPALHRKAWLQANVIAAVARQQDRIRSIQLDPLCE